VYRSVEMAVAWARERRISTLEEFFDWFGKRCAERLRVVCSDMWKAYLRAVRAYLFNKDLQQLWDCRSPTQARKFLNRWCRRAMRSRLEPMKKVAKMLRKHRPLVLNWFRTGRASIRRERWKACTTKRNWRCEKPTGSDPTMPTNSLRIIHLGICQNMRLPTDLLKNQSSKARQTGT
jgi:hypothetical protein